MALIDADDPRRALEWFDMVTGQARAPEPPAPVGPLPGPGQLPPSPVPPQPNPAPGQPPPSQLPLPGGPMPPVGNKLTVPGAPGGEEVPFGAVDMTPDPEVPTLAHEAGGVAAAPFGLPGYPAPPRPPDPLGDARRATDAGARAAADAVGLEKTVAGQNAAAVQDRQAAAADEYAAGLAANAETYTKNREAAKAQAQAETGAWLDRVTAHARREPSPNRLWADQDRFGRALWLLGMAFSGAAGIGMRGPDGMPATSNENPVLKMLQVEMARDVESQRERLKREGDVLQREGDVMMRNQSMRLDDLKDDRTQALLRLQALGKAMELRASTMTPAEIQRSGAAAAMTYLKQAEVGILAGREKETFTALQAAAQRAATAQENRLDRVLKLQLAREQMAASMAKADKGRDKDVWHLGKEQGVAIKGRNGGTMDVPVRKEVGDKAASFLTNASQTHADYVRLRDAIKGAGSGELVLDTNREIASVMSRLAYGQAKIMDPGGRLSDQDINQALRTIIGDNGTLLRRVIRAGDKQGMIELLDKAIAATSYEVKNKLGSWIDRSLLPEGLQRDPKSYDIDWVPAQVAPPPSPARTVDDEIAAFGGIPEGVKTPTTLAEFEKGKSRQDAYGKGLPKYDASPADKLEAAAVHADPARIRALAKAADDSLAERKLRPGEGRHADPEQLSVERLAVASAAKKALEKADKAEAEFRERVTAHAVLGKYREYLDDDLKVADMAAKSGFERADPEYIAKIVEEIKRRYPKE